MGCQPAETELAQDDLQKPIGKALRMASQSVEWKCARVRTFWGQPALLDVVNYSKQWRGRSAYDTRVGSKFLSRAIPVGLP